MSKTFTIYRSSAGSGKTRTLAKEYLKLALRLRSQYFRHILAVTFTNKATQEMKDRIIAYLTDFAAGNPGDLASELKEELKLDDLTFQQYAQETLSAILHEYSHFAISTIDAFFQKVIRSFTREAGLSGDYRLEIDQDPILEEVIDDLIDELGSNKELTEWVVDFARENLENERPWDVRSSLLEFSREIFREEFKRVEDQVMKLTSDRSYFRELKNNLGKMRGRFIKTINQLAKEGDAVLRAQPWSTEDLYQGKNAGVHSFFTNHLKAKKVSELKEQSARIKGFAADPFIWPNKKTRYSAEIIRVAETELVPRMQRILEMYEHDLPAALSAELALQNLYVFGLVADISRKLREYKDENNMMLLADAPKFLQGVIQDSDAPFIYEKVGSFYRNYLIDEFQDTSGLQWSNFLPLVNNSLSQGYNNLVVGDVKQAIYRWRGGDLSLLQQKLEDDIGRENIDIKNLSSNYRSSPEIVNFNNAVFEKASAIVALETGADISAVAYQDISQNVSGKPEGFVQVKFLTDNDEQKWKEQAMHQVPLYMEQLQESGILLKDIAILVRKNEEGQDIIAHLLQYQNSGQAKEGCRYDVVSGESLRIDSAATVSLLEAALKYLLNADDSIARAQLGYEYAILNDPERVLTEVFAVSNQAVFENYLPDAFTKEKIALKKLPLYELTENLIRIFQLGKHTGELPYLMAFQNLVLDFHARERNDLGAFLEWWEDIRRKKAVPVSGEVDAAQVISIHKSKGLQFKYVLLPFCAWAIDHDTQRAPQLWVKSSQPGFAAAGYLPVKYSSSLERTYFADYYREEKSRTYLDNLNLLYVALTRAERGMVVMAPDPANGGKDSIARLLYESIGESEKLRPLLNNATNTLFLGNWTKGSPVASEKDRQSISLDVYPVGTWRDKLVIRQSAKDYFDPEYNERQEKINYGLHVHAVLSRIKTSEDVPRVLNQLVLEGVVADEEKEGLHRQLEALLQNDKIARWFSSEWDVRTEVPILIPGGSENRIDRLLVKGKHAVVIDFKTGNSSKADQKQVLEYLDILRQMNFTETEGFLLYVKTGEVFSVTTQKTKMVRKKSDSQLDLGL